MDVSYKNIFRITLPVLVSMMVEQLIGITDTAFLGHVGEVELGASAIAGVCYLILFVIGSGFGVGLQVLIARLNGEKNYDETASVFSAGLYFLMIMGAVVIVSSKLLVPFLLHMAIKSDAIYLAAESYLSWRVYGLLFSFTIIAFRSYFVGITKTRFLTYNSLLMVGVNILCNYLLIFGHCGLPALGIAGAAMGSSLAEAVAAIVFFFYFVKTQKQCRFVGLRHFKHHWHNLRRIMHLSFWTMVQSTFSLTTWLVFFIVIEHIGEEPLAISNVVRSISSVPFMIIIAFASTGSSLVSNLIGEGRGEEVMRLSRKTLYACSAVCLPLLLLIGIFPQLLLRIYTNDTLLIANTLPTLYVLLSSYIFTVPSFIYLNTISGTGNTPVTMKITLTALAVYLIYILIMAKFLPDVAWLWTSEHVNSLMLLVLSLAYIKWGKWQHKQI